MLNIVPFGVAFLRIFFKHFPIYHFVKVVAPGVWPFMTLGTSFEQTWISSHQGYFIPNIRRRFL